MWIPQLRAARGSHARSAQDAEGAVRRRRKPLVDVSSRGSTAPSPTAGKVAEQQGSAAVDDPAQFVPTASPAVPEPTRLGGRVLPREYPPPSGLPPCCLKAEEVPEGWGDMVVL